MNDMQDISNKLDRIERLAIISSKTVLGLSEAAIFTGYSESHIYNLTSRKAILFSVFSSFTFSGSSDAAKVS